MECPAPPPVLPGHLLVSQVISHYTVSKTVNVLNNNCYISHASMKDLQDAESLLLYSENPLYFRP